MSYCELFSAVVRCGRGAQALQAGFTDQSRGARRPGRHEIAALGRWRRVEVGGICDPSFSPAAEKNPYLGDVTQSLQ